MKSFLALIVFTLLASAAEAQDCSEIPLMSGVVPIVERGVLVNLKAYGTATVAINKASLVAKANNNAELKAKRSIAEWMKQDLSAESLLSEQTNAEITTDIATEQSTGSVVELQSQLDTMKTNASAVLVGVVVLRQCFDPASKQVRVEVGWKPEFSSAAATTQDSMLHPPVVNQSPNDVLGKGEAPSSMSPGVRIRTVVVIGIGDRADEASNQALRQAVAQVHGQKIASKIENLSLAMTVDASSDFGLGGVVAVESDWSKEKTQVETSGLIESYRELKREQVGDRVEITLEVRLPVYDDGGLGVARKVVFGRTSIGSRVDDPGAADFGSAMYHLIQEESAGSRFFVVLDRDTSQIVDDELSLLTTGRVTMSEMSKVGQKVGADYLVTLALDSYTTDKIIESAGDQDLARTAYSLLVTYKVIEVATSKQVDANRVVIRKKKFKSDAAEDAARLVSQLVLEKIESRVFGSRVAKSDSDDRRTQKVEDASQRSRERFEDLEEEIKDEW